MWGQPGDRADGVQQESHHLWTTDTQESWEMWITEQSALLQSDKDLEVYYFYCSLMFVIYTADGLLV